MVDDFLIVLYEAIRTDPIWLGTMIVLSSFLPDVNALTEGFAAWDCCNLNARFSSWFCQQFILNCVNSNDGDGNVNKGDHSCVSSKDTSDAVSWCRCYSDDSGIDDDESNYDDYDNNNINDDVDANDGYGIDRDDDGNDDYNGFHSKRQ